MTVWSLSTLMAYEGTYELEGHRRCVDRDKWAPSEQSIVPYHSLLRRHPYQYPYSSVVHTSRTGVDAVRKMDGSPGTRGASSRASAWDMPGAKPSGEAAEAVMGM